MTYADATDVAARWGKNLAELDAAITALIDVRLADVERMILKRIPDLAAQITASTIDVEDVKQVESDAVLRLARNPDGYQAEGDGSYRYQLHNELASGVLEITPRDWATLGVAASSMMVIAPKVMI